MKTLTIIPMIHTLQEFGSVAKSIKREQTRKLGIHGTEQFYQEIEQYWKEVARRISAAGLLEPHTAKNLAIFIDALPNVHEEIAQKIITDLSAKKIPAYLIIQKLQEAGAKVYGTEDPQLLLKEHAIWTRASKGEEADPLVLQELLEERDQAIAKRIEEVLPEDGQGILFIGKAHNVTKELEKLPRKFSVIYL